MCSFVLTQRIQYAKGKLDCVAIADGSYDQGDKRKKQEEKSELRQSALSVLPFSYFNSNTHLFFQLKKGNTVMKLHNLALMVQELTLMEAQL